MKNLANCTPSEFIAQTARIKDAVVDLNEKVNFSKIRAKKPKYKIVNDEMTAEQKKAIIEENAQLMKEQAVKNTFEMLDKMLVKYPKETLTVLSLSCFVEPSEVDNYTMDDYFGNILDMLESKNVSRFFTYLVSTTKPQSDT